MAHLANINTGRLFVQETISGRREANQQEVIQPDHAVWNVLNNDHYGALENIINHPLTFNPANYPQLFVTTMLPDQAVDEAIQQHVVYYVRVCRVQKQHLLRDLDAYNDQYPADIDWTENMSLSLRQLTSVANNENVSLLYFGVTLANTPEARLRDDLNHLAHTRFGNWNRVNRSNWAPYSIQQINIPRVTVYEAIDHPLIGLIEDIFITACRELCLNSAHGGFRVDWNPTNEMIQFWEARNIDVGPYLGGITAIPNNMVEDIQTHFFDYYRFVQGMATPGPRPHQDYLDSVIRNATPAHLLANAKDRTLSLIVGEGTTATDIRQCLGYWDDNAGVGPEFLRRLFRTFHRTVLPPFVDLVPLSTQNSLQVSVPFLTRYLRITRPIILLGMSNKTYTVFQNDLYSANWVQANAGPVNTFLNDLVAPRDVAALSELIDARVPLSAATHRGFTRNIGSVSIVRYGPGHDDLCLCIPIRQPGNLSYDPVIQQLKCTELYYTLCLFHILQETAYFCLTTLHDRPEYLDWLEDVIQVYEQRDETTVILQRLTGVRNQVEEADRNRISARFLAARNRSRPDTDETPPAPRSRFAFYFIGQANSNDRVEQLEAVLQQEREIRRRRLTISPIPRPANIDIFSNEFRQWFLTRGEGINMQQSARAYGRNPMAGLNEEQREDYLRQRGFGPFGAIERIVNRNTASPADTIAQLADEDEWKNMAYADIVRLATCSFCGDLFLFHHNTFHRCPERREIITSEAGGLQYFRALYPHDIIDNPEIEITQEVLDELHIESFDAVTILNDNQLNLNNLQIGALGQVYTVVDSPDRWRLTQAIDKLIVSTGHGNATLPNYRTSDSWLFNWASTRNYLRRHIIGDPTRRPGPLVRVSCGATRGAQCDYVTITNPHRVIDSQPLPNPVLCNRQHTHNRNQADRNQRLQDQQRQHRIGHRHRELQQQVQQQVQQQRRQQGDSRRCLYGVQIRSFWALPLAAKRYLWAEYRTWDDTDNLNPAQEFRTRPAGQPDPADHLTEWENPIDWAAQYILRRS